MQPNNRELWGRQSTADRVLDGYNSLRLAWSVCPDSRAKRLLERALEAAKEAEELLRNEP